MPDLHNGGMQNPPIELDAATLRLLAVRASCDPRTIRRVACGEHVRGLAGQRARAALIALGYPIPEEQQPAAAEGGRHD